MDESYFAKRIEKGVKRGEQVTIWYEGQRIVAYKGETIASALMAAGQFISRSIDGSPMGVYCNSGVCHSCLMKVNGVSGTRACQTPVSKDCVIERQIFEKGDKNEKQF